MNYSKSFPSLALLCSVLVAVCFIFIDVLPALLCNCQSQRAGKRGAESCKSNPSCFLLGFLLLMFFFLLGWLPYEQGSRFRWWVRISSRETQCLFEGSFSVLWVILWSCGCTSDIQSRLNPYKVPQMFWFVWFRMWVKSFWM